ncbi:hypothetical protein [Microcoleus sp. herbarium14]|uniref:hypothetical protein n=1 Tax=Microcoleus sp. herbarium14 TaxID=3055439 RepID=UPI002FD75317
MYQGNIDILLPHKSESKVEGPDFVEAYMIRARIRAVIGEKQGGVEDFQKAIDIYRARGQSQIADMLLVPLNSLQNEIKYDQEDQSQPEVEDEPKAK